MTEKEPFFIDEYFTTQTEVFTLEEFIRYLKKKGLKVSKEDAKEILSDSELVFSLVDNKYVTKSGVFNGRCFSFKPSLEEVQKGYFIIGHRAMPFVNSSIPPDRFTISTNSEIIKESSCVFSIGQALKTFSLYGDGYAYPIVIGDHSNNDVSILQAQFDSVTQIRLTAWPLKKVAGEKDFTYGDRIFCRVVDWATGFIDLFAWRTEKDNEVSIIDIEREEWYKTLENSLITSIKKNGPCLSIEEQLAYLFLEYQEDLCREYCGSIEEFLQRPSKLDLLPFGMETRIWEIGKDIPFIGHWAQKQSAEVVYNQPELAFTNKIFDSFITEYITSKKGKKIKKDKQEYLDLIKRVFPFVEIMNKEEKQFMIDQIELRIPYLLKQNEFFENSNVPVFRKRVLEFYQETNDLLYAISNSGLLVGDFPSQELTILVQLYYNSCKMIDEVESAVMKNTLPLDEYFITLEGMEGTFYEIKGVLKRIVDKNAYKELTII